MKNKRLSFVLSLLLCIVLITATALFSWGCGNKNDAADTTAADTTAADTTAEDTSDAGKTVSVGEGAHQFTFTVRDAEGNETVFDVHTDKGTVGDALTELELIEGEEGQYGLYVKTVNGITADYDVDGTYWAFYVDGEYAATGVDLTEITDGASYMFAVEK